MSGIVDEEKLGATAQLQHLHEGGFWSRMRPPAALFEAAGAAVSRTATPPLCRGQRTMRWHRDCWGDAERAGPGPCHSSDTATKGCDLVPQEKVPDTSKSC